MKDEILDKVVVLIRAPKLSEGDVLHLLTLHRKLIERLPGTDKPKYSVLKLYCDWVLHSGIDHSGAGAALLLDAHNIIADHLGRTDNSTFGADLTAALSLNTCRAQMNALLASELGVTEAVDQEKWDQIVPVIAEIISHCPLSIGKSSRFDRYRAARAGRPLKGASVVEELTVIKIPSATLNPGAPADQVTFCVMLTTSDTTRIVTPIVM